MTIAYVTTASTGFTAGMKSGYVDTANNYYLTVTGTAGIFKRFNMATGAQVGSNVTVSTSTVACCLINSASAFLANTTGTLHQFIELSSGYVQTVSAGGTGNAITKNDPVAPHQIIAVDTTNNIALFIGQTNSNIVKVTTAQTYTVLSTLTGYPAPNQQFTSLIFKGNRRWLAANQFGRIYEIDDAGVVYDEILVNPYPHFSIAPIAASTNTITIWSMSYGDNLLLVSTNRGLFLYDYTTKTVISQVPWLSASPTYLSEMYNGVVLTAKNYVSQSYAKTIYEIECSTNSLKINGKCFLGNVNYYARPANDIHINITNGNSVLSLSDSSSQFLIFANVTARASTTRTINVNPDGVHKQFRLWVIDDTLGQGNRSIIFDTFAQSPYTYRVPTGKSFIEVVKVQQGTSATWGLGRFST